MIVGSTLCSKNDWLKMPDQVLHTIDLLLTTPLGQKMRWLTYRNANTKKYTNLSLEKWSKNDLKRLLDERKITAIIITDKLKSEDAISVVYSLDCVKNFVASGLVNKIEATFHFDITTFEQYINWLHEAATTLKCVYGFVHGFDSGNIAQVRDYLTAMHPTKLLDGDGMRDWSSWQRNKEYCNQYIRNTYWGNILNWSHIQRLNGTNQLRDQVKKEGGMIKEWSKNLLFICKSQPNEATNLVKRITSISPLIMPEEWIGAMS